MVRRVLAVLLLASLTLALSAGSSVGSSAAPGPPPRPVGGFGWPLPGTPTVTRRFEPPPRPWLPGHRGVDLAGTPGAAVLAAGAGTVAFAGTVAGTGVVSVEHAGGLRTTYEPVRPTVRSGQSVTRGQPIGTLPPGHPGCPVAACLHWGLRRDREYLDPLALLGSGRVRLWPVSAAAPAAAARAARTPPAGCTPGRIRAAAADRAMGSPRPRYAARRRSGRGVRPPP